MDQGSNPKSSPRLSEFLLARLADDEETARMAQQSRMARRRTRLMAAVRKAFK